MVRVPLYATLMAPISTAVVSWMYKSVPMVTLVYSPRRTPPSLPEPYMLLGERERGFIDQ